MNSQSTAVESQCPRCENARLDAHILSGRVVGACKSCGGIFLDNTLSQEVVQKFTETFRSFDFQQSLGARSAEVKDPQNEPSLPCPRCRAAMHRTRIEAASVFIDACATHGTWFDRQELSLVGRALADRARANAHQETGAPFSVIVSSAPSPKLPTRPKSQEELAREDREIRAFQNALRPPKDESYASSSSDDGSALEAGLFLADIVVSILRVLGRLSRR
jgi:Zn-finger nucleic acid-binding protein